jgi:hypothetical protein
LNFLNCAAFPPAAGGNIAPFMPHPIAEQHTNPLAYYTSILRSRSFPVAGTYTYHSKRYGTTGTILVVTDP